MSGVSISFFGVVVEHLTKARGPRMSGPADKMNELIHHLAEVERLWLELGIDPSHRPTPANGYEDEDDEDDE